MKRLFALFIAAAISISASAATLLPIQLLNPAGSSSGQAIVSTGASSAPAWGGVPVGGLAAIASNSVIANATNSSAIPTAVTVTGCNGAAQALQWTNGTGFGCNSAIATSGANSNITSLSSPTITTPNIVGVTSGSAAAAGSVGETLSATGTAVSLTSGTPVNCTSKALNAGDYDVWGNAVISAAATTIFQNAFIGINTTSATQPASPNYSFLSGITFSANATYSNVAPQQPINLSSAGTVFLVITPAFTTSTATATCTIFARRRR